MNFTDFLTDLGKGIGYFIEVTTPVLISFSLALAIGTAITALVSFIIASGDGSLNKELARIRDRKP